MTYLAASSRLGEQAYTAPMLVCPKLPQSACESRPALRSGVAIELRPLQSWSRCCKLEGGAAVGFSICFHRRQRRRKFARRQDCLDILYLQALKEKEIQGEARPTVLQDVSVGGEQCALTALPLEVWQERI
eukprot:6475717-Amphidinium_carterae.1